MLSRCIHRIGIAVLGIVSVFGIIQTANAQLSTIDNTSPSITQELNKALDTNDIDNPLRQGSHFAIQSPDGNSSINTITMSEILGFADAQNTTLGLIKNIINVLLSFTALIVLIYMIYEGYMIVTAGTNEEQYKEALKRLKNAAIAIAGITMSWFIVSFIFAALNTII